MSKAPAWWYAKSDTTSILFTIFVIITDVFMMPILFAISGYVLSIQLKNIRGPVLLINRVKKLGIPWFICVLIFSPYLSLLMAKSLGKNLSYSEIITHYFWTDYYSQGPYWFLSLLLTF
jgi:fucose 4-O-acetylase-like acetyltransferase